MFSTFARRITQNTKNASGLIFQATTEELAVGKTSLKKTLVQRMSFSTIPPKGTPLDQTYWQRLKDVSKKVRVLGNEIRTIGLQEAYQKRVSRRTLKNFSIKAKNMGDTEKYIKETMGSESKIFGTIAEEYYKGHGKAKAEFSYRWKLWGIGAFVAYFGNSYLQKEKLTSKKLQTFSKKILDGESDQIHIHESLMNLKASEINCIEDYSPDLPFKLRNIAESLNEKMLVLKSVEDELREIPEPFTPKFLITKLSTWTFTKWFSDIIYSQYFATDKLLIRCKNSIDSCKNDIYFIDLIRYTMGNNHDVALKRARIEIIRILENIAEDENVPKLIPFNDDGFISYDIRFQLSRESKSYHENLIKMINEAEKNNKGMLKNDRMILLLETISFVYLKYPKYSENPRLYNVFEDKEEENKEDSKKYKLILELEKINWVNNQRNTIPNNGTLVVKPRSEDLDNKGDDVSDTNARNVMEKSVAICHNIGYSFMKIAENQEKNSPEQKNNMLCSSKYLSYIIQYPMVSFMPAYSFACLKDLQGDQKQAIKYYKLAKFLKGNDNEIREKLERLEGINSKNNLQETEGDSATVLTFFFNEKFHKKLCQSSEPLIIKAKLKVN